LIRVTKLNGEVFYVNPYEIEFIEETPDTVISLKSGKKVLVVEKADSVINEMINFYRLTVPLQKQLDPDETDEVQEDTDDIDDESME
jgi:flagellar protein FlbD